jgi:enoyl-CoA hydratase
MTDLVAYRLDANVATVTMDDGKVNVISRRMLGALNAALDRAAADDAVVILTGRSGVFSAGFDLKELMAGGTTTREVLIGGFELAERLLAFPTPVVIACSGHAMAMGVFLVLAGDYRVGADGPYKIVANEVAIGLTMPYAATELCRQRLTRTHFNRAVITAELYTPDRALPAGFLDEVVAPSELERAARAAADRLGKLDRPAFKATKLRARSDTLAALRRAIELDDAALA